MKRFVNQIGILVVMSFFVITTQVQSSLAADGTTDTLAKPPAAAPATASTGGTADSKSEPELKCEGDEKALDAAADTKLKKQEEARGKLADQYVKKQEAFNAEMKKRNKDVLDAIENLKGIEGSNVDSKNESAITAAKDRLKAAQGSVSDLNASDSSVAALDKSIADQEAIIKTAERKEKFYYQSEIDEMKKKLESTKKNRDDIAKFSTGKEKSALVELEKNKDYKQAQNYKKYRELIKANNEKLKEIGKTPLDTVGALVSLKTDANKKYCQYLKAKYAADDCEIRAASETDPGKKTIARDACTKEHEDSLKKAAENVRVVINQLTKDEQILNQEADFNVSNLFSVKKRGEKEENLSLTDVTNTIADWMILLVGSLAVTALIIGGFMMVISGGDETRLETGKTIFTYSLIGVSITMLAYGIIRFIQSLFYST